MHCPFCGAWMRDLFGLSLHLEDDHPGRERELVVAIAEAPRAPLDAVAPGARMPGVDIDRVHSVYGGITRRQV
jgi:hypothetical protein